jgi:hypothetical protein
VPTSPRTIIFITCHEPVRATFAEDEEVLRRQSRELQDYARARFFGGHNGDLHRAENDVLYYDSWKSGLPGEVLEHASHQVDFRLAAFRIGLASECVAGYTLGDHGFRQRIRTPPIISS